MLIQQQWSKFFRGSTHLRHLLTWQHRSYLPWLLTSYRKCKKTQSRQSSLTSNGWTGGLSQIFSSKSRRHLGHYKAGASSNLILNFYALKTSIVLQRGIFLEHWSQGLSMLEKAQGCALISQLRSILLVEADFNCTNKILYGIQMLDNV